MAANDALMLASVVARDENGHKRIPVLLDQLKIRVSDSRRADEYRGKDQGKGKEKEDEEKEDGRHLVFRIELEYGNEDNRSSWVIHRSLTDLAKLHGRYKIQFSREHDAKHGAHQPHFPLSAFPYMRGIRGLGESDDEAADDDAAYDERAHKAISIFSNWRGDASPPAKGKQARPSLSATHRRKSSGIGSSEPFASFVGTLTGHDAKKAYNQRQRMKLEQYLQAMIRWLMSHDAYSNAHSNRLCKFLEISALGIRLAPSSDYHGKEGALTIKSTDDQKWFLVRDSYIVWVDSPDSRVVIDLFLVDPKFAIKQLAASAKQRTIHHTLEIQSSERTLRLRAKNDRQLKQFEDSIRFMAANTEWAKPHRFDSFAPVRTGVLAEWFVDGRDHMWALSKAIDQATDTIYIHDWWLSPELYLRRPATNHRDYRLDRLLEKKAREGVKIFVIIYRNIEDFVPINSNHTKCSLLDRHPNIHVQRSPNQYKQKQIYYAHHEKLCIIDDIVAFVGGIDLCFGRWDTPDHLLVDDAETAFLPSDATHNERTMTQTWPGKDYNNPRVQDFTKLEEPLEDQFDRNKTPRMPWHDISMTVVGQPARDLARHFVQRWNYVLRGRTPHRPTPFLIPPRDFRPGEVENLGLNGSCEVQMLRSASTWSLGLTPDNTEHSIMNAYLKMIEESEHFVYIENQFFITSSKTMGTKFTNKIGDAIVERATRASRNKEAWHCVVLIPLMPGFAGDINDKEGYSLRLIMQCQYRSISRGEGSIYSRLEALRIEAEEFVTFYSLRTWGRIGPEKALTTEQVYIHAKIIIADDRTALIGSANINERSMLGSRDSECAAFVRDQVWIKSSMAGKPYEVGSFAHSLRMRLMSEHLGLDMDGIMRDLRLAEADRPHRPEAPPITRDCMRDPVDSRFLKSIWKRVAAENSQIYRTVFRCSPDDTIDTLAQYTESKTHTTPANAEELLGGLVGNLVMHPLSWLKTEEKDSAWLNAGERLVPLDVWD